MNRVGIAFVMTVLCLRPSFATGQYVAQELRPPADDGYTTVTRAFAINHRGQVFGEVFEGGGFTPVLWTDGNPTRLPIPDGYSWNNHPGAQFLADDGTAASFVIVQPRPAQFPLGPDETRLVTWKDGVASVIPPPPVDCSGQYSGRWFPIPVGLNRAGHVLVTNMCQDQSYWLFDLKDGTYRSLEPFGAYGYDEILLLGTSSGPRTRS